MKRNEKKPETRPIGMLRTPRTSETIAAQAPFRFCTRETIAKTADAMMLIAPSASDPTAPVSSIPKVRLPFKPSVMISARSGKTTVPAIASASAINASVDDLRAGG